MSRPRSISVTPSTGFPRVSGDEPVDRHTHRPPILFSPRERG